MRGKIRSSEVIIFTAGSSSTFVILFPQIGLKQKAKAKKQFRTFAFLLFTFSLRFNLPVGG